MGRAQSSVTPEPLPTEYWIDLMAERLAVQFNPERIVLFGSHARGEDRPDSDVDLLVVLDEVDERHEVAVEMRMAVKDIPVAKDIVVTTTEEIARRGHLIGTVLRPALTDGRNLYVRG